MNFSFIQVLAGSVGALLIYAAIKNETPVTIIQGAMGKAAPPAADERNPSLHGTSNEQPPAPVQTRPGGTPIYVRPNPGPF